MNLFHARFPRDKNDTNDPLGRPRQDHHRRVSDWQERPMHPRCVDTRRAWRNRTTTALLTRATMRMNLPVTGRDVSISDTANILSTTDLNGDITYVNPDFIKISGFDEDELLGQHHNIVRHPDMPREAFADLWSSVRGGNSDGHGQEPLQERRSLLGQRVRHPDQPQWPGGRVPVGAHQAAAGADRRRRRVVRPAA